MLLGMECLMRFASQCMHSGADSIKTLLECIYALKDSPFRRHHSVWVLCDGTKSNTACWTDLAMTSTTVEHAVESSVGMNGSLLLKSVGIWDPNAFCFCSSLESHGNRTLRLKDTYLKFFKVKKCLFQPGREPSWWGFWEKGQSFTERLNAAGPADSWWSCWLVQWHWATWRCLAPTAGWDRTPPPGCCWSSYSLRCWLIPRDRRNVVNLKRLRRWAGRDVWHVGRTCARNVMRYLSDA